MGLHLSPSRLRGLERTLSVLSAPLEYGTGEEWAGAVNRRVVDLFGATGGGIVVCGPAEEPIFNFHGLGQDAIRRYRKSVVVEEDGTVRFTYPDLDRVIRRLVAAGIRVWTPDLAQRYSGIRVEEMSYVRDVIVPTGTDHRVTMALPLEAGLAILALYHASPEQDPLGKDRVRLLQLMLPAFRSGLGALSTLRRGRGAILEHLEGDATPCLVLRPDGRILYRNPAARSLLDDAGETPIMQACRELKARLAKLRRSPRKSDRESPAPAPRLEITAGSDRVRLSGTVLPPGVADRQWTALVRLSSRRGSLPAPAEIEQRLDLTPRQSQVAQLIALGLTSREIADRLEISVHTARRHTEAILARLDLTSRAGVAARLLSPGAPASGRAG